jgi:multidrug efflux pump subunit AcrA (membrane-fusion protein)
LLFVIWICITGCSKKQETNNQKEAPIPVKVVKVKLQNIEKTLDYVDDIKAKDEAQIYPKVNGKVLEKIKEDGSSVSKGDIIAYIDRDEVGLQFEKAPVESPLSGIIGRVYVDKGTNVSPQTPIALVVSIDNVKIDLDIPERYTPLISIGQEASIKVDAYPEEKFIGKVSKISPVIDLSTRTAPIEIIIPNADHRLKPGMFARVQLSTEKHESVPLVLKEAFVGREPNLYLYVIKDNKAVLRKVTIGIQQGTLIEVTSGLEQNENVVIMGQQKLRDGVEVNIVEENND